MPSETNKSLNELERLKRRFDISESKIIRTLSFLAKNKITDAESLIRFHETLLFLRAYPQGARVLTQVERILRTFAKQILHLREAGIDLSALDDPEVSGIAGMSVTSNFSYAIARWLTTKYPSQVSIDWDWLKDEERFGATMPRFLPLLKEDALVEAHVPYRAWLRAAKGRKNELVWLIERFESLKISDKRRSELYDSLKLHVTWRFGFRSSRTGMKLPVRKVFFHDKPLIRRRDISLINELAAPPIPVARLSPAVGEKILDMARETSAVRYRELHGFTYGDSQRVLKADLGRGTEAFVMGVPAEHRLPLRAYHAALILKNGVPVAYFEGLSLFERMESGFNLYYTFRDGETAWLYARILRLMRQLLGVTVFSIDPYQAGHENEEGIESGAFWFYRKLGFRPVRPELLKLAVSQERKIAANQNYRTSARTLRKLAAGHMLFEAPVSEARASARAGQLQKLSAPTWDHFEVRNLGLAVQRRMARDFDSDAERMRGASVKFITRALGLNLNQWGAEELSALENLALVFAMIPGIDRWSAIEKLLAARIIRAKASRDEANYLRLMQRHSRLRSEMISLGS